MACHMDRLPTQKCALCTFELQTSNGIFRPRELAGMKRQPTKSCTCNIGLSCRPWGVWGKQVLTGPRTLPCGVDSCLSRFVIYVRTHFCSIIFRARFGQQIIALPTGKCACWILRSLSFQKMYGLLFDNPDGFSDNYNENFPDDLASNGEILQFSRNE